MTEITLRPLIFRNAVMEEDSEINFLQYNPTKAQMKSHKENNSWY